MRRPSGAAQLALPDYRRLDERVFGTPDLPQACGGTLKNGTVTDTPVLVHGLLTEMNRVDGRKLAMDDRVTPPRS